MMNTKNPIMVAMSPEMQVLKARSNATWLAGDFGQIARSNESGAAEFITRIELAPGARVRLVTR